MQNREFKPTASKWHSNYPCLRGGNLGTSLLDKKKLFIVAVIIDQFIISDSPIQMRNQMTLGVIILILFQVYMYIKEKAIIYETGF